VFPLLRAALWFVQVVSACEEREGAMRAEFEGYVESLRTTLEWHEKLYGVCFRVVC